ncbi:FOXRED1 [Cordylochernes scorpioides]|uniref:FAD-dependent oxidoreductase domain-containing protein 1 n=1 Tax=Cordylochernes scorpioides TaxID=51811 RepID=A0ABY6L3Q1_9ARAC|nr:FOXRED1 [Cordylochernes scorpioides]
MWCTYSKSSCLLLPTMIIMACTTCTRDKQKKKLFTNSKVREQLSLKDTLALQSGVFYTEFLLYYLVVLIYNPNYGLRCCYKQDVVIPLTPHLNVMFQDMEPDPTNLDIDYKFFDDRVWPILANRVPSFNSLKLKSAWAGFYDYNYFDQNVIIGYHPWYTNIFFATGFSGHGIQMAPAVGRAVMEILLDGEYLNIDLSRFGFDRIIKEKPIWEANIV